MEPLKTLPGDDVRQILWRFQDRFDLQMLVQSTRRVARGSVARLVAAGGRNTHDWTPGKSQMLRDFDEAGVTSAFTPVEQGGLIDGPKNLALALVAWELSWVDAGAATASLANCLGLAPIVERGTEAQRKNYMGLAAPQPGSGTPPWRGAFALTEPIPYVGVETGLLSGKVSVAEWKDGQEPLLKVEKRGRFITNIAEARFVTAAVDTGDPKIKTSCMVILEDGDPGTWDKGTPTKKLVHQLSSTGDPVFSLTVPAHRIVGGYTVKDGVIVPNYSHAEIIEAVFRKSRVTVGAMSAAKILSAIEPVIRYQRDRFRGGTNIAPGTPRYEQGLQQKEDALNRLLDVWAFGEASASLGFAAARAFDDMEPLEHRKEKLLEKEIAAGGTAVFRALRKLVKPAVEYLELAGKQEDSPRFQQLKSDDLVQYLVLESIANVLCPAAKLWCTGVGADMMREAVSLMGGYGITEDCPGFLCQKWMDIQLEATYEGPEAVQRRQLSLTMTNEVFLGVFRNWARELRAVAHTHPGTGACALASAMDLWLWTVNYLQVTSDPDGGKLYTSNRHGVTFPLADALCWLTASYLQIKDVLALAENGPQSPTVAEALPSTLPFLTDLCRIQVARAGGEVGRIAASLVFGYNRHASCEAGDSSACFPVKDLTEIGTAGVQFKALEPFIMLRTRLDACLAGAHLARDRAAVSLTQVMIPAALDYPA